MKPHFLFNTLANVQALVDAGSPRASGVLKSLIAYLRAAVPRLQESTTTIGDELELVRAYLEVMHMRMPDRLQFALRVDELATRVCCPPMTLLTLVENAVRHGIDPSEEGGRIDVEVATGDGRVNVRVTDTGVGLKPSNRGLGSGLAALRERLALAFGGDAELTLEAVEPRGVARDARLSGAHADCMTTPAPTALIADDEPLLRDELARLLASDGRSSSSSRRRVTAAKRWSASTRWHPTSAFSTCKCLGRPASKLRNISAAERTSFS